jgi:glc operon protein GlcG
MRKKPCLTAADVQKMAAAARAEAERIKIGMTIAIADDGGHLLYLERMDGAMPMTADVATAKARSSGVSRRPTRAWQERTESSPSFLAIKQAFPIPGGFPIIAEGECIGGISASGGKGEEDEQVAQAGLSALGA